MRTIGAREANQRFSELLREVESGKEITITGHCKAESAPGEPLFRERQAADFRRVFEHDAGQIAGGKGAVDVALEALAAEVGQIAAVVDVRVAQDHGVNLPRVEGKAAVTLGGLLAMPLEQAAFEQEPLAVDLDQVHRAGGGAGGAEEMNFHRIYDGRSTIFARAAFSN